MVSPDKLKFTMFRNMGQSSHWMILNTGSGYNDTRNQIDHFIGKSIRYTCNKTQSSVRGHSRNNTEIKHNIQDIWL